MVGRKCGLAAALAGVVGASAQAAPVYSDLLVFETAARQSSVGSDVDPTAEQSVRMTQTWNATSSGVGSMSSVTAPSNPVWYIWKGCKETVDVFCGSEPDPNYVTTRSGAEARFSTAGEVGFEVDASLDAGSIKPKVAFEVGLGPVEPVFVGNYTYLNPTARTTEGEINLRSPTARVKADLVLGISAGMTGEGCVLNACTDYTLDLPTIPHADREVIEVNLNEIQFLEGFLPSGVDISLPLGNVRADFRVGAFPPYFQVATNNGISVPPLAGPTIDVANVEVNIPQYEETGILGIDGRVRVTGEDDILDARLDIDAMFPGLPTGGAALSAGPFSVSLDTYDIEGGPSVDFFQDLEMTSDLGVRLDFDKPTFIDGIGETLAWVGDFLSMPAMIFNEETTITPTFFVESVMKSVAGFQFGLEVGIDLLKGAAQIGALNYEFGPLVNIPASYEPNFLRASLFDTEFSVTGWNSILGSPFTISPEVLPPLTNPIPLPASWLLLLAGTALFPLLRRRAGA